MRLLQGFVIILCVGSLFLPASADAGRWISLTDGAEPGSPPTVTVISSDESETVLSVEATGFWVDDVEMNGEIFQKISFPDEGYMRNLGEPELPVIGRMVVVPDLKGISMDTAVSGETVLEGYRINPAQKKYRSSIPVEFKFNREVYSSSKPYPSQAASKGRPSIMRDYRFVRVEFHPVRYIGSEEKLIVNNEITVTLRYEGPAQINPHYQEAGESISPTFAVLYKEYFINYNYLPEREKDAAEPLLIICYDEFATEMDEIVQWKTRRGLPVTLTLLSDIGTSADDIQDYLQEAYDTWSPKPVYVWLIGDGGEIPTNYGIGGCASDYMYTTLEGSDIDPDVFIGRLSAQTGTEVANQTTKFITHESTPQTGEEAAMYLNATGVSSSDGYPVNDDTRLDRIKDSWIDYGIDSVDRLYISNGQATPANIIDVLDEGRFWITYMGHGDRTGWTSTNPKFSNSHIDQLNNEARSCFVVDIACQNGAFVSGSDCFGEHWLKVGTAAEPKGAVGCYSSSTNTAWDESGELGEGITYAYTEEDMTTYGAAAMGAMLYLEEQMGSGSNVEEVFQQFVLFGDPSIHVYAGELIDPVVTHDPFIPLGSVDFQVTVTDGSNPIEGAVVSAWLPGEFYEVELTDASGVAVLSLESSIYGDAFLTVTGNNIRPHEEIVPVMIPSCGIVTFNQAKYHCSAELELRVWDTDLNTDPGVVDTAEADISSDSEPAPEIINLTETGADTNEFLGTIMLSETESGPGYLLVSHEDVIIAHYYDEDCEGEPVDVYETAEADCEGPTISGVSFFNVTDTQAIITWTTDEASDSAVYYGFDTPPTESVALSESVTEHVVLLEGLDNCSKYYFYVTSTDGSGNTAIDDNSGEYFYFNTLGHFVLLEEMMDADPGWTVSGGDWEFGQPTGQGGSYGDPDPTSGYTGDNVYGYNLNGDYTNSMPAYHLTTPPLDCSMASGTTLTFYRWLGVEQPTYDHAVLSVSNDGTNWDEYFHNEGTISDGDWVECTYDISASADGQSTVYIRWSIGPTDSGWTYCGWNIDDVEVSYLAPCNVPILTHDSHTINDQAGNANGEPNPGECIVSEITLYNNSGIDATNISATVSETSEYVSVTNPDITFPDISAHEYGSSIGPHLAWDIDSSAPDGAIVQFSISWTSDEGSGNTAFSATIMKPILNYTNHTIDDCTGDNDGIADPGESIVLPVLLTNSGHGIAMNVAGTLSTSSEHIVMVDDAGAWNDIPGEESGWSIDDFGFEVSPDAPLGEMVEATLQVYGDGFLNTFNFTFGIGALPVLVIDDDSGDHAAVFTDVLANNGYLVTEETPAGTDPGEWPAYTFIVWSSGDSSEPVSQSAWCDNLESYVADGGKLLIEGGEIAYDFYWSDPDFLENVCHVSDWNGDSSGDLELAAADHPIAFSPYELPSTIQHAYSSYYDEDACDAASDAEIVFGWSSASGGGLIVYDDDTDPGNGGQIAFYSYSIGNVEIDLQDKMIVNTAAWLAGGGGALPTPTPSFTHGPPTYTPSYTPTYSPTSVPPTNTPTFTPTSSPTDIPPTYTPTETPTEVPPTWTPTSTPTGIPTDIPTQIPTYIVTETPTAVLTGTPSFIPSPTPNSINIQVILNLNTFRPQDDFILECRIVNPGPFLELNEFIILEVYGSYWFYDDWTQNFDYVPIEIPAYSDETESILQFVWPEGAGTADGLKFYAALLDNAFNLVTDIDVITWGFEE